MYKPKKAIAAVCAAAILMSPTGALGASAADYADFPNDWSSAALTRAIDNGLLGGVGEGRIAPQGLLTRAQMAAIINRAFASSAKAALDGYSDVSSDAWYRDDMAKAVQMGTFAGAGSGMLEPERAITREEAFSVLARAFALKDGDTNALTAFSDGDSVSSWAKGTVAAMVGGGYVNGSDGARLNPKASITRAEFAAVMSNLVAQYIDAATVPKDGGVIDGNVIVRQSDANLSGLTIKGDVIIADTADTVQLDKVTAEGRIVVRGASKKLILDNVNAKGVVVNNPNRAAVLSATDGELGTVTVQSDVTLAAGSLDTVQMDKTAHVKVDKGAAIKQLTASAEHVTIDGNGSVEKVAANANGVTVLTKGSIVTAAKGASGVMAGDSAVAAGESATVDKLPAKDPDGTSGATKKTAKEKEKAKADNDKTQDRTLASDNGKKPAAKPDGTSGATKNHHETHAKDNTGKNGKGDGQSGTSTSTTTPGTDNTTTTATTEDPVSATLVNAEATKLVDLGWCQYVTVQFTDGHSLKDCTLTVDGTDVSKAFTPISDDGSLVKWEITALNPAQLTVKSGDAAQTVALSDNASPTAPAVHGITAPDYIIAHGTLSTWDYHLTNYDDKGQVRVDPAKTTFSISGKAKNDAPAFFSPETERSDNGSGSVLLEFSQRSDADRAWFAAVPENTSGTVQLVAFNENKNTLNDNLAYTKNGDGTISIALGQKNFTENGRYYVRVNADGHDPALVPIHVVNALAPVLQLDGSGTYTSGVNAHFKILNMTYGVTNPAYAAELTRPDGSTVELEMIRDWYQIGDSFVLYNDVKAENGRNNLPNNGTYTLTVHANGFKDMSATFTVTGGEEAPVARTSRAIRSLDARSSATSVVPGGGTGGSGGSGGLGISANLKFDADLLINAELLDKLGLANDAAKGIVGRWHNDMSGYDTAWTSDGTAYNWRDYITAVSTARAAGSYLSFADYTEDARWETRNKPSTVKSVLEDNLLGDVQSNGTWVGQQTPEVMLVDADGKAITAVPKGEDIRLKASDAGYFKKLNSININKWPMDLDEKYYHIDGDTLTIDHEALGLLPADENTITLYADGFRAKQLSVRYTRNLETGLSISGPGEVTRGEQVRMTVEGSKGDFLNHLTTVTVYKPSGETRGVYPRGAGSYDDNYYTISKNNVLTIVDNDGTLFNEDGRYTISLDAQYYNRLTTQPFVVSGEKKATPQPTATSKNDDGNYVLTFDSAAADWGKNLSAISVNSKAYGPAADLSELNKREYRWSVNATGGYDLTLQGKDFNKDDNSVTIAATGYNDATFHVAKDAKTSDSTASTPTIAEAPAAPAPSFPDNGTVLLTFNEVDSTWQDKLTAISVNGTTYSLFDALLGTPGDNQYQWQDNGTGKNALYLNKSAFKTGENIVTLSADGYKDMIVSVSIAKEATPEPPAPPVTTEAKDVPTVSYGVGGGYSYVYFDKDGHHSKEAEAYAKAVTSVSVNDTDFEKVGYYYPDPKEFVVSTSGTKYIAFKDSTFKGKDTTVVIKANGYKDLSLTVDKDGELTLNDTASAPKAAPEDPSTSITEETTPETSTTPVPATPAPETKDVPTVSYGSSNGSSYFYFDRDGQKLEAAQAYVNAVTSVSINDVDFEKVSYYHLSTTEYMASSNGQYKYLFFNGKVFNGKSAKVVIKADGYKDLTFTVSKDGQISFDDTASAATVETTETPTMPEGPTVEKKYGAWFYTLSFANADNTAAYLSDDSFTLTVNGTKYEKSDVDFLNNDEFHIDTSDNTLMLHDSSFTTNGNTTVTIHVDGYQDRVLTIDRNGALINA